MKNNLSFTPILQFRTYLYLENPYVLKFKICVNKMFADEQVVLQIFHASARFLCMTAFACAAKAFSVDPVYVHGKASFRSD